MLKFLPHAAPLLLNNRLTELTFFVTTTCNMRCKHCFIIDELNKKTDLLSVDEVRRMGRHIPYMQRVHISGGEPFTREDLAEIALVISNEWRAAVVCIPNNGWFRKNLVRTVNEFGRKAQGNLRLFFSINSPDPQEMDAFTGLKGSLERWIAAVKEVAEHARQYRNVRLIALSSYNDYNMHVFPKLIDFVLNHTAVDEFSFHLVRSHESYHPELDLTNYRRVVSDYFRNQYKGHPILRAYRELIREIPLQFEEHPERVPICQAGSLRAVMAPNGDVYPCERLGYPAAGRAEWFMGNIREFDYNIKALLASEPAVEVRRKVRSSGCQPCHEIDTSLNLLSTNRFKMRVLARALKYALVNGR